MTFHVAISNETGEVLAVSECGDCFHGDSFTVIELAERPPIGGKKNEDGVFEPPPAPVVPILPPPVPTITRAQAKIQLHRAGLLDQVKTLVEEAGFEAEMWFAEANVWQRDNAYVVALGAQLPDLDDAAIDQLFRDAALIDA